MKGLPFVLLFTAMTFVAWGAYGPTLHHGAVALEHDSMRAFVGVGLAYFMIAVLIPFFILKKNGEVGKWTISGAVYSLIAGAVGAIGALGIILALGQGGATIYVMPLVFGFAPVVNTLVTAFLSRTFNQISPIFIAGIITAALGAGGVLVFKPTAKPSSVVAVTAAVGSEESTSSDSEGEQASQTVDAATDSETTTTADEDSADSVPPTNVAKDKDSETSPQTETTHAATPPGKAKLNWWGVLLSIVIAAVCWGSYGPMLHIGQGKMSGSRLRPFACVGLAYFFIAVAAPLMLIYSRGEDAGAWTASGMTWSFLAGVAGAIGALGVILAFNAGGKPYYVMPLIFGFAPVINTFISLSESGTWSLVRIEFWVSLAVVIAGAVTVLTNAPKPKPKPKPAPAS